VAVIVIAVGGLLGVVMFAIVIVIVFNALTEVLWGQFGLWNSWPMTPRFLLLLLIILPLPATLPPPPLSPNIPVPPLMIDGVLSTSSTSPPPLNKITSAAKGVATSPPHLDIDCWINANSCVHCELSKVGKIEVDCYKFVMFPISGDWKSQLFWRRTAFEIFKFDLTSVWFLWNCSIFFVGINKI